MNSTLIVYYSRTGVTRHVAQQLADLCAADLLQIQDVRPRDGMLGYLRSAVEATHGRCPPIALPEQLELARYQLVVLATPVWASHVSSPMRTFLRDHAPQLKRVAFLCTMGGSGADAVFAELRELAGQPEEATCALTDREVLGHEQDAKLRQFAAQLSGSRRPDRAPRAAAPAQLHVSGSRR